MTEYDADNVEALCNGHGDWFTAQLFRLICKADESNRYLLSKGFPAEVKVVSNYLRG